MKYIVLRFTLKSGVREMPIMFPDLCIHETVASNLTEALQREFKAEKVEVVSAGFCTLGVTACFDNSETLALESRGEQDKNLINGMDYFHGIVD